MKLLLLFFTLSISTFFVRATVYTSIADGNWNAVATWDGNGIPPFNVPTGDVVNVKHEVDYASNITVSGQLSVHATGILDGNNKITVSEPDGLITNEGTIDAGTEEIHVDGLVNNSAYIYAKKIHLDGSCCNSGLIKLTEKIHIHGGNLTCCGSLLTPKLKVEKNTGDNYDGNARSDVLCQNICNYSNTATPVFEVKDGKGVTETEFINNDKPGESFTNDSTTICNFSIGVLPVTISLVYGQHIDRSNYMYWETASELNNDYFTIEKSEDLNNWVEIGIVNGAGNSNTALKYQFEDDNVKSVENYYRIKQTDDNGSFTYSKTISITGVSNIGAPFPNPVKSTLTIQVSGMNQLVLMNQLGETISLNGRVYQNENFTEIDVIDLDSGVYFIRTDLGTFRFVKL